MMSATPPAPDDLSVVEAAVNAIVHYGPVSALIAIVGLVWRGGASVREYRVTQGDHDKRLSEQHAEIAALKASDAENRITIASLPTRIDISDLRDELRAQAAATQSQMQSGFDNLSRMIARKE